MIGVHGGQNLSHVTIGPVPTGTGGEGPLLGGLQAAEDGAQSIVHAGQPPVDVDRVGVGLLPLHVGVLGDEVGLAGEQLVDVPLDALEGAAQLGLVRSDAVEGAIQLGLADEELLDLIGQVGHVALTVAEEGVVLRHAMGVGQKGRGVPIQLGLELVEDLLDGEGLVCEE